MFTKINRAYEVLKDEDLRKKYDMHGEDGLKEDGPSGRGFKSWNFYQHEFGKIYFSFISFYLAINMVDMPGKICYGFMQILVISYG